MGKTLQKPVEPSLIMGRTLQKEACLLVTKIKELACPQYESEACLVFNLFSCF